MYWLVLYDRNTGQIEGFFSNSRNYLPVKNVRNPDPSRLSRVRLGNPLFEISLDHKLIIVDGKAVGSSSSSRLNPPQPDPVAEGLKQEWQEAQQKGTDAKLDMIARLLGLKEVT